MKTPSKLLIGVTTAATILSPIVPKTVNITFNDTHPVVAEVKVCTLISTIIDDRGKKFCEYRCGTQLRIMPNTASECEKTISEKLIK